MTKYSFLNGTFVAAETASIGLKDLGLLRGFGVFDFFLVKGGKPLFLDAHMQSFFRSAKGLRMSVPHTPEELRAIILEFLRKNNTFDAGIRLVLTGGTSPDGFSVVTPSFFILEEAYPYHAPELYDQGIRLLLHQHVRQTSSVKSTNYIVPILQNAKLREAGAQDLLYHDGQEISESSRANFFAVLPNRRIVTPIKNIFRGVTRQQVLEVARYTNYRIVEDSLTLSDLATASEAFLTSTTNGILPVIQIDGQPIGNGQVGAVSQELMAYWDDYVEQHLDQRSPLV